MEIRKVEVDAIEQKVVDVELVQLAELELVLVGGGTGDVAF